MGRYYPAYFVVLTRQEKHAALPGGIFYRARILSAENLL